MSYIDIADELESYTGYLRGEMPAEIADLAAKLNTDLYSGPSYYTADGDECSCFDDGAIPFDFRAALAKVGEWADAISDCKITCYDLDEGGEEVEYDETLEGSARMAVRAICGRELAAML